MFPFINCGCQQTYIEFQIQRILTNINIYIKDGGRGGVVLVRSLTSFTTTSNISKLCSGQV